MQGLFNKVRAAVSRDKNRLRHGTYDLDLTYITNRIIGMAFPADGFEKAYRNNISHVAAFLDEHHGEKYMVYNLSERKYAYERFGNRVLDWCGFRDHHAPPLALLFRICSHIDTWLAADPENVVVIHCLAGKGRTGTVIAAYFIYCGLFADRQMALNLFATRRSVNMLGVTGGSQRRYVGYLADTLSGPPFPPIRRVIMENITLSCAPDLDHGEPYELLVEVFTFSRSYSCVFTNGLGHGPNRSMVTPSDKPLVIPVNCLLRGDVLIVFYVVKNTLLGTRNQKVLYCAFHTVMEGRRLVVPKSNLDKAYLNKMFPNDFVLTVDFKPLPGGNDDAAEEDPEAEAERDLIRSCVQRSHQAARDGTTVFKGTPEQVQAAIAEARVAHTDSAVDVEKAGFLTKQGGTVKSWRKRWFVLRNGVLSYYKSPTTVTPAGEIPVTEMLSVMVEDDEEEADDAEGEEGGGGGEGEGMGDGSRSPRSDPVDAFHSFIIRTAERDYVARAETEHEVQEWVEALEAAIRRAQEARYMGQDPVAMLHVIVVSARDLSADYWTGAATPFCVLHVEREKEVTAVDTEGGSNPTWSQRVHSFMVRQPEQSTFELVVWDKNDNWADRFLGQVKVPIADLRRMREPTGHWYPLQKRTALTSVSGSVHVVLMYEILGPSGEQDPLLEEHRQLLQSMVVGDASSVQQADVVGTMSDFATIPAQSGSGISVHDFHPLCEDTAKDEGAAEDE